MQPSFPKDLFLAPNLGLSTWSHFSVLSDANLLQDFTIVTWKAVEYASHYMTAVWSEMLKEKIWATEELHFKMVKTNKQEGTSGTEYKDWQNQAIWRTNKNVSTLSNSTSILWLT